MALQGKGIFIWRIASCENGDANAIAALAQQANLSHALLKIADGVGSYNFDYDHEIDLLPPVVQALHARGIQTWGWHYVYGNDPVGEANKAIQRLGQLNLDGYAIDAEGEYKEPGKQDAARKFMELLRSAYPSLPISLCSYRFPSYHPQLPWKAFLEKCDYNMPQVYWQSSHNPGEQLTRTVSEFQSMTPYRPILPVGSAYVSGTWSPSKAEIQEFLQTAQKLNLTAASFWEWNNCRKYIPEIWDVIRDYPWSGVPPAQDITQQFIEALNSRDPGKVINFYSPTAIHVTSARTIQGATAIRSWYQSLFSQILPNAKFTLTGFTGAGESRHFSWTVASNAGAVQNGNDTLGLLNGKIVYHYTFFSVS